MNLLLDSCTFLFTITGAKNLSQKAQEAFLNEDSNIYLSVASIWEMSVKYYNKKLILSAPPEILIPEECKARDIRVLPIDKEHIWQFKNLPPIHKDPFDRIIICQAMEDNLTILTPDKKIKAYPINTLW